MVAKLRSCCRIAAPVGGSAVWPTSEEPARIATPKAAQNGTFQRVSRRSVEDVIGGSHDSTAYDDFGAIGTSTSRSLDVTWRHRLAVDGLSRFHMRDWRQRVMLVDDLEIGPWMRPLASICASGSGRV